MIWLHSEEELDYFLARLNSFHETIKFTWEIGYREISFLDACFILGPVVRKVDSAIHRIVIFSKSPQKA